MNKDMGVLLREEESIFRHFGTFRKLSDLCTAYASPASDQFPHWNLIYPPHMGYFLTEPELRAASSFYKEVGRQGHVLLAGSSWAPLSAETVEYFVASASDTQERSTDINDFSIPAN